MEVGKTWLALYFAILKCKHTLDEQPKPLMGRNIYLGWMQSTQVDFVFKTFDRKTVAKLIQTILSKNTKPYLNPVF